MADEVYKTLVPPELAEQIASAVRVLHELPDLVEVQRETPPPALQCAELRLSEDCGIVEMTLLDEAGNVAAILSYGLQDKPEGFDMMRLAEAWDIWRGSSTKAS